MRVDSFIAAGYDEEFRQQISLRIPKKLLEMVDKFSKGNRSRFIIKAVETQIALEKQKECLKRIGGSFSQESFDGEDAITFVDKLRKGRP